MRQRARLRHGSLATLALGLLLLAPACGASKARSRPAQRLPAPGASSRPEPVRPGAGVLSLSRGEAVSLLCRALRERDVDCDRRITLEDERRAAPPRDGNSPRPPAWPYSVEAGKMRVTLDQRHEAAQLVTELVLATRNAERGAIQLDLSRVRADPATYLAYRIEHHFWDALTRRVDADPARLLRAAADEKLGRGPSSELELCPDLAARCGTPDRSPPVERGQSGAASPQGPARTAPESPVLHVYFPVSDPQARSVFQGAGVPGRLETHPLPARPSAAWLLEATRERRHGLLTLALGQDGGGRPFVVPGGRFNEMYGWDSFFIAWGLAHDPHRLALAQSIAENHAYQITHYGKILNANRTYYLTRSQPPFLTSTVTELLPHLADTNEVRRWLETVLGAAVREYDRVWNRPPRTLPLCDGDVCLARYFGEGQGEPPEVEPGHFDWFYQAHAVSHGHCPAPRTDDESRARFVECAARLAGDYRAGKVRDAAIDEFFAHDACVRESGHDTTFRWFVGGQERCGDFATVDLNSLLFKYELDLSDLLARFFPRGLAGRTSEHFCARARARARLVRKHLWDGAAGLFFDYDTKRKRRSDYLAATTLYPLWASVPNACGATLITPDMAQALRTSALRELETRGGLFAASPASLQRLQAPALIRRTPAGGFERVTTSRQWEAPNGWAPHQMLAWTGLRRAGFEADAQRLAYRWLFTIVHNAAAFHGTVPEKFDVLARSHAVFQEYGNVNSEFAYIADEGFGWMNASFLVGWQLLEPALRKALKEQVPPERLFGGD